MMELTSATFEFLYPRMKDNGIYLIEDMHTAYMSDFGGGLYNPTSMIGKSKNMVDLLNAYYCDLPREFADATFSISFYDSIIVFEK